MATDTGAAGHGVTFALPLVVRRSRTGLLYWLAWAPYIAVYQVSNRWPVTTPIELPLTVVDRALPFVPALLPVYVAYIPFFFWTVYRSRSDVELNRLFYGTYLQLLLSLVFFVFYPVAMPRHLFYGAESFGWADAFWRWFDAPNNCFPSLHVSNCLLFTQLNWGRPQRHLHTALAAAVIASTVLVKQHYVVDLLGGVAVYFAARALLARVTIVRAQASMDT